MPMIGQRINPSAAPVPAAILDSFRNAAVAVISDNMNRLYGTRSLRPYHRSGRLIGTAVTVKTRPGDNQTLHKAYEILRAGDVLVVDGAGDLVQALVGEIMMSRAKAIGVAGFVIDGAIRDVDAFVQADFPCYARGVTHRGPYKSGPGEINVPVAIDGLVRKQEAREADALAAIAEGRLDNPYIGVEKKS
jgi:regulator of RNase E activity RraA